MGGVVEGIGGLLTGAAGGGATQYSANQAALPFTQQQLDASNQASLDALKQQQALASQLSAQGGLGTQTDVLKQQQALANQLQAQTLGQGPNPAQEQYRQNINAGTQAAAGTIASQKGISPALAAELIARQQGAANQNAASNAAQLQAQQQLAAQQALQAQQAQLQNVAGGQVANQMAGQNFFTGATQGQQGQMLGAQSGTNAMNLGAQNSAMQASAASKEAAAGRQSKLIGGLANAGGALLGMPGMGAEGGMIMPSHFEHIANIYHGPEQKMAEGGNVKRIDPKEEKAKSDKAAENVILKSYTERTDQSELEDSKKRRIRELLLNPEPLAQGGYASYQSGALVPGEPKVDHNSYSNDTVKALLSPGEVVIPLDVMNSKDPVKGAAAFVKALLDKKNKDSGSDEKDFHSAVKSAISKRGK